MVALDVHTFVSFKRIVTLAILGLVLSSALLSANVLVAADRTVMDSEYAAEKAEQAELHEALEAEIERELRSAEPATGTGLPIDRTVEDLLTDAVTREYVQTQVEANMDRFYAYLHGDADELRLEIETRPIVENVLAELETELEAVGPADFDERLNAVAHQEMETAPGTAVAEMAENESQFMAHRERFEERVKQRIQEETAYPMTDEQLEQAYQDRREEIRAELIEEQDEQIDAAVSNGTLPADFEEPVRTISVARIDALTSEIGYETYVERVETGMDGIRAAALAEAEARLTEEVPETVDLTEEFGAQERSSMETARTATSTASTLALVLPLVALVTAGLVAYVFPASVAARLIGSAAAVVGLAGLLGAHFARTAVGDAMASADGPEAAMRFVELLLEGLFGMLTWQSGGLLVVGIGLVGLSVAIRRDLILPDYR